MARKKIRPKRSKDHALRSHEVRPYNRLRYPPHDDNFANLIENWAVYKDRLTILLGAGASVGAKSKDGQYVPTAAALRNELWKSFMCTVSERQTFDPSRLGTMTLEHASALIEARTGAAVVREFATKRFDCAVPLWQHSVLPWLRPKAVFTTNYDNLIELGWAKAVGNSNIESLAPVFRANPPLPLNRVPLFKPHGTVEHADQKVGEGGLVLNMFDYFQIIGQYQGMLRQFIQSFSAQCVVFIGYSFMDMDIGAELYRMRQQDKSVNWYAVFPRNDSDVRAMYQEKFGIRQINRTFFDFMVDLDDAVDFIDDAAWKWTKIKSLQKIGQVQ